MSEGARIAATAEEVRLLVFSCAGERFALDLLYTREIIPLPELTPVPFVPATVAGIANHRGTIYTLVRFARLAGLDGDDAATEVVLLRLPEMAVGITVDAVEGIERLPVRPLAPAAGAAAPDVPFLSRAVDHAGRLVHAVDADLLVDTIYQLPDLPRPGEA